MKDKELERQKEAEKTAYQTFREEPVKLVETFDNKSITIEKPSKQKKWIPVVIGVVIAIFFLLLAFLYLKIYPKYMLMKSLDSWTDSFDVLKEPMSQMQEYDFNEMTTKGTAKMEVSEYLLSNLGEEDKETLDIFSKLNSLSIDIESRINKKEQKAFIGFTGKIEEESFFNIGYRIDNGKQYLLLKDVLETYLMLEDTGMVIDENSNMKYYEENFKHVWQVFKKGFKKNIKSSYIKRSNETIIVDGKKIRTTKISLLVDEKVDAELTENIIKDLKKDKKANEFLVKLYPDFATYDKVTIDDSYRLSYSVNVTKIIPRIVKVSFVTDEDNSINLVKGEDYVLEFLDAEKPLFRIITREEKDGFKMKFQVEENGLEMVLTGRKDKNSIVYNLTTETNGVSLENVLTLTQEKKGKDVYEENGELELKAKAQGLELSILKINFTTETEEGAIFDEIQDSKLITELTEEEQEKIRIYFENIGKLFEK